MQLDLKTIVNVQVNLASRSAARKGFNVALILGPSTAISTGERVKIYTSVSAMLQDGFTTDTPEYKAASLYFPRHLAQPSWPSASKGKKNRSSLRLRPAEKRMGNGMC